MVSVARQNSALGLALRSSGGGQISGGIVGFYPGALLACFCGSLLFWVGVLSGLGFVASLGWVAFVPVASAGGCFGFSVWLCCFWVGLSGVLGKQGVAAAPLRWPCALWVKVRPSLGLVLAGHRGEPKLLGLVVVWLWLFLLGLTSQSKGRAARWRFCSFVFIRVRRLRLNSVSGAPLTVTLGSTFPNHVASCNPIGYNFGHD